MMKLFFRSDRKRPILTLAVLCVSAASLFAEDFKTVRDGVEYAELTRTISGLPIKMNLLRLDLTKVRLDVVHAMDMAIGTETVSSMAKRHGAFAAINAGFFRLDTSIWAGDAVGLLMINRSLLSESYANRSALEILNDTSGTYVVIERINASQRLEIDGKSFDVGINRERKAEDIVVFNQDFGRSTLTNADGVEFIVVNGKVADVRKNSGSNLIPWNGYVISVSGNQVAEMLVRLSGSPKLKLLESASWPAEPTSKAFGLSEDIVAGVPQLIKNGKIDITWEQEKASKSFVETRHPRTAVAKLKDGKFLMITVDGRSESSGGIGLYDLAALLLEFGATDAMNLDGGGSTTMYLDGKVVNKPSDKEGERKVSDAILVTLRKK